MKKLFILSILLLTVNCKDDVNSSKELFFNPESLSKLLIENLDNFWESDSLFSTENPHPFFKYSEGFLKNSGYETKNKKIIEVIIFESKQIAISAMEEYRSLISAITYEGDSKKYFGEKWWNVGIRKIWVIKNNTLIYLSNLTSEDDNISLNTATEILNRIENLSK